MNPDYENPFASFLDDLIGDLEAQARLAYEEARHAAMPGVTNSAHIALYALASIEGGPCLTIVYEDSDGVVSIRHITVNAIERCHNGHTTLRVNDLDRGEPRSFRMDRIKGAATEYRQMSEIVWAQQ